MRGRLGIAALALLALGSAITARAQQGPRPAQIDRNGTLILIRSTLIALQQANETGNYTVLRDLGAPGFREANSAARLSEIFANLRNQKLDLGGILALDPQLTMLPQIESGGEMHMAGFFPSVPTQINFELVYAPVDGRWRPYGVSVRLGSSSPVAPSPPPASVPVKPEKPGKSAGSKTKTKANRSGSSKPAEAKPSAPGATGPKAAAPAPAEPKPEALATGGASLDR